MSLRPYVHVDSALAEAGVGDHVGLSEDEQHHLRRVLRLRDGADVEVADGVGATASAVLASTGVELTSAVAVVERRTPELWVAQGLPKGRKLDEVIQQVTELGVDGVVPILAERSIARPEPAKYPRLHARWSGVARAACEQSRRPRRPDLVAPHTLAGLLDDAGALALPTGDGDVTVATEYRVLLADPSGRPISAALQETGDLGALGRLVLAVGPEGGWSDQELAVADAAGAQRVALGPTVLRTEHAAAAGLAAVQALLGRW